MINIKSDSRIGILQRIKHCFTAVLVAILLLPTIAVPVSADTQPTSGTPATVSADALPTVQVNGIVWDQAVVGTTVYAGGSFTAARPAGVAVGGAGSVARGNLLAYDITTGNLITSFDHTVIGTGNEIIRAVKASPDGTKLFIGGTFSAVDGQPRKNFAAIDLTTNTLLPNFTGAGEQVRAIAATNTRVYIGGQFLSVAGYSRAHVAAFLPDGTVDPNWKADVTGTKGSFVMALVATESYGNLIIGGTFNAINGATYYSTGAVKLETGKNVAWASQSAKYRLHLQVPEDNKYGYSASRLGVTSLSFDGKYIYLTAFTYLPKLSVDGTFEGRAAINPANGKIIWLNDCDGDSYDAVPVGDVLYSVGHPHDCRSIGGYPDQYAQGRPLQHVAAETTARTSEKYDGLYYSKLLNWYPSFGVGAMSGAGQAGWTIEAAHGYVAIGGEFPTVNGAAQQGLVRFTVASNAPNKVAPNGFTGAGYGVTATPADKKGRSTVRVYSASDKDNVKLTYELYRSGSSTLLASKTYSATWWQSKSWTYTDTGIPAGTSLTYTVVVKDQYGNATTLKDTTLIDNVDSRITYSGSGWKDLSDRSNKYPDFGRTLSRTTKNGNSMTMKFTGTSITVLSEKGPDLGQAEVSIDGGTPKTIDMYFMNEDHKSYRRYQVTVFSVSNLSAGQHTIKITKTSGTYLTIDAIKVR